jgi:hypothetical protein
MFISHVESSEKGGKMFHVNFPKGLLHSTSHFTMRNLGKFSFSAIENSGKVAL